MPSVSQKSVYNSLNNRSNCIHDYFLVEKVNVRVHRLGLAFYIEGNKVGKCVPCVTLPIFNLSLSLALRPRAKMRFKYNETDAWKILQVELCKIALTR